MAYDYVKEDQLYKVFETRNRSVALALCDDVSAAAAIVSALNADADRDTEGAAEDAGYDSPGFVDQLFRIGGF